MGNSWSSDERLWMKNLSQVCFSRPGRWHLILINLLFNGLTRPKTMIIVTKRCGSSSAYMFQNDRRVRKKKRKKKQARCSLSWEQGSGLHHPQPDQGGQERFQHNTVTKSFTEFCWRVLAISHWFTAFCKHFLLKLWGCAASWQLSPTWIREYFAGAEGLIPRWNSSDLVFCDTMSNKRMRGERFLEVL